MGIWKPRSLALSGLLIVQFIGCGGGGDGAGTTPRSATIWSNGSAGCWGDPGDTCDTGGQIGRAVMFGGSGLGFVNVATTDTISGGVPSLQVTSSNASAFGGFCIRGPSTGCVSRDLSAFKGGHLQFNIQLDSPTVTAISVTLFSGLTVQIPTNSLSVGSFTHKSIALTPDLFGTNGPQQVLNVMQFAIENSAPSPNQPVFTLNDVKWTTD